MCKTEKKILRKVWFFRKRFVLSTTDIRRESLSPELAVQIKKEDEKSEKTVRGSFETVFFHRKRHVQNDEPF